MLNSKLLQSIRMKVINGQQGVTLIEAVIGIALLSIVAVAVVSGVFTAFKASATSDKQSTALTLAQSQLEYMQVQDYVCADSVTGNAAYQRIDDTTRGTAAQALPSNYSLYSEQYDGTEWNSANTDPAIVYAVSIDEDGNPVLGDLGIQKITLIVYQNNNVNSVTMVAYKVKPTNTACP